MTPATMERSIQQLLSRVRDLENEVAQLRQRGGDSRVPMEAAIVSIESGNTVAAALGPLASAEQTVASGVATVMEIIDVSGTLKLKPIQNSAGSNRETLTYWNPHTDKPIARTAGHSFLVVRLRDGRWIRVGGSGSAGKLFLTTTTITARTGSSSPWTPGNGSGNMIEFYDDAGTLKMRTTGVIETLRHGGDKTIASGRIVQAKLSDGHWTVDVDYC